MGDGLLTKCPREILQSFGQPDMDAPGWPFPYARVAPDVLKQIYEGCNFASHFVDRWLHNKDVLPGTQALLKRYALMLDTALQHDRSNLCMQAWAEIVCRDFYGIIKAHAPETMQKTGDGKNGKARYAPSQAMRAQYDIVSLIGDSMLSATQADAEALERMQLGAKTMKYSQNANKHNNAAD